MSDLTEKIEGEIEKKIENKIKEETGLKTPIEIQAYTFFYKNAGLCDNTIPYGNVQLEFYCLVKKELKKVLKTEDLTEFSKDISRKIDSAIIKKAKIKYEFWLDYFRQKGLIARDDKKVDSSFWPVLIGYSPLNDREFYIPCREKGEKEWNVRVSTDFLTPQEKQKRIEQGYEFYEFKEYSLTNIEEEVLKSLISNGNLSPFAKRQCKKRIKAIQKKEK